jgi:hypothetical protein
MEFISKAYYNFENNVSNLRRLFFGLRYLKDNKKEFIESLMKNGERFPEAIFNQELENTINQEIEIANILLRSYVEKFGFEKCGDFNKVFLKQYKTEIDSYKIEYQRNLPSLSVLDINRDLRDYSVHSNPKYKLIQSSKTPFEILSEKVLRITNDRGDKKIALLHDLDLNEWGDELKKASSSMPLSSSNTSFMSYGELLRDEVMECIHKIDLIKRK